MRVEMEKYTMNHFFSSITQKYIHNKSLGFVEGDSFTFKEFKEHVDSITIRLNNVGIKKGDKVLLLGENSPNWCFAFMAITTMGAVVVPVLVDFPESDINHVIRHSGATAAFVSESIYHSLDLTPISDFNVVISLSDFSIINEKDR